MKRRFLQKRVLSSVQSSSSMHSSSLQKRLIEGKRGYSATTTIIPSHPPKTANNLFREIYLDFSGRLLWVGGWFQSCVHRIMFDMQEMMLSNFLGVDNNSGAFLAKHRIDEVPFWWWWCLGGGGTKRDYWQYGKGSLPKLLKWRNGGLLVFVRSTLCNGIPIPQPPHSTLVTV